VRRQTALLALVRSFAWLIGFTGLIGLTALNGLTVPVAFAQSGDPTASGPAAPAPQSSPTPATCTANCALTPAKPVGNSDAPGKPQGKPSAKPHKVITNEDFDALPHYVNVEGGYELMEKINTCDRTCFEEVARRANATGRYTARWKLALLDAVDAVKYDSNWQGVLGQILGVQSNACELQVKKTQDLQRFSDPRTVTPSELAIEREYEPKFREINARLNSALARANAYISKNADGVLQSPYMHLQVDRVTHATCTITVPPPPDDTDDP
jgi:hypothetical protein